MRLNPIVKLTEHELQMAAGVGVRRHIAALERNLPDRHGYDGSDGWTVHVEGACGELAVARFLGRYWDGSVNTFRSSPDVAGIEVRTRSNHGYDLIHRADDDPDKIYVLVTGRAPDFWVRGWMMGADCRRDEWSKTHGGRPAAWFVPKEELNNTWPKPR